MSNSPTLNAPVPYSPGVEKIEADEQKTADEINASMQKIREKTYADGGHAIRSVHAKSHGLLIGEMTVIPGLPATLMQGLFEKDGTYPVVLRLSTVPGDIVDDNVSTPRGMALKILHVEGARLPGSEADTTQDFVMVNGPAFNAPSTKPFNANLKLLAATTDRAEGAKKALSSVLQVVEKAVETFGAKSATLTSLGGQPETHPLGDSYFTQAPIRYGAYMAKVSVAPVSPALMALTGAKVDLKHKPDGLREAVSSFFASQGGEWELRVQLCTDLEKMPIEDASVEWPQDQSPYVAVARISVKPQPSWNAARAKAIDDGLLFSPWHGIAAFQPLGNVMRARKVAYEVSARFRMERNGSVLREPTDVASLGG